MPAVIPVLTICISWPARLLGRNKHSHANVREPGHPTSKAGGSVRKDLPGRGGCPWPCPPWGALPRNRDQEGRYSPSSRAPNQILLTPREREISQHKRSAPGALHLVLMGPCFTLFDIKYGLCLERCWLKLDLSGNLVYTKQGWPGGGLAGQVTPAPRGAPHSSG